MENINKLYKSAGKCDDQQKYKVILEAYMVSTPEGLVDNILMDVSTSGTLKNPSARKSRSRFLALLDIIQETNVRKMGAAKKSIITSEQSVLYGILAIGIRAIQNYMKILNKLYIIELYIMHVLCSLQ